MQLVKNKRTFTAVKRESNALWPVTALLFCIFFSFQGRGLASTPNSLLDSANQAYTKGNFENAVRAYEQIISDGYESPEVYFNLGNSCYKLGKIGMSILNYERAKKLSPFDKDINFNLKLVGQQTQDKIESPPKLFLEEWWESIKSMHSEKVWGIGSILCFALFLFFIAIFIMSNKVVIKQLGFWFGFAFLSFSFISFFISKSRSNDMGSHNAVVILSSSVEVKNAPSDIGKKLFILHEGAKVSAPEIKEDWVKVELTSEKVGWVKRSSLEFI